MSGSVNKVLLIGNLARDPEVRSMQDGSKIVNITVVTSERWRDKSSGEQKEKAEFHRVVIFNEKIADVAERFLKKGSKTWIEGQLQTRKWTNKDGADQYSTEVVIGRFNGQLTMLDSKAGGDTAPRAEPAGGSKPADSPGLGDEIMF